MNRQPERMKPDNARRMDCCARELLDEAGQKSAELAELAAQIATDGAARDRLKRISDWDESIEREITSVEIPVGMADRLLARLAAEQGNGEPIAGFVSTAAEGEDGGNSETISSADGAPMSQAVPRGTYLRGWLPLAAGAGMAAAVVMAILGAISPETAHSMDDVFTAARDQFDAPDDERQIRDDAAPEDLQPSKHLMVSQMPGVRWWQVDDFLGRKAVVYDLSRHGRRARLFVVNTASNGLLVDGVTSGMPSQRPATTGGFAMGAWSNAEGDRLYVLIVEGDERDYQSYLRAPGAVAWRVTGIRHRRTAVAAAGA